MLTDGIAVGGEGPVWLSQDGVRLVQGHKGLEVLSVEGGLEGRMELLGSVGGRHEIASLASGNTSAEAVLHAMRRTSQQRHRSVTCPAPSEDQPATFLRWQSVAAATNLQPTNHP